MYQGFQFANFDKESVNYQNYHGDLMLNISSFYRTTYTPLPKWNVIPYVGAGIIRNSDLHNKPFAISYGVIGSYRMSKESVCLLNLEERAHSKPLMEQARTSIW